ncbi:MAG: hypothetical protein NT080_08205 [Spirochaetes bacterium]|nr:hypothetical protein [Spirochaetota bacterium]
MRIAALWKHDESGRRWISGEISSDVGICLHAGAKLLCKIVKNEKKVQGDKVPDAYLEVWFPRPRQDTPEVSGATTALDDDIPF